jgi:anti-sigma factor RsiW
MNTPTPSTAEHQHVWELLPWLVNGRLSEPDCRRVEAHLYACSACREEVAAQRAIYQVIAADTAIEQMPTAGLNKLRQRIDRAESAGAADSSLDRAPPATPSRPHRARRWQPRASAIAASVLAASATLAISAAVHWQTQRGSEAKYYTVTTASAQHTGAVVRAVFAPTVTLSELQVLLDDAHLRIVAGPTEAGVYSLAMSGPQSIDWSLRRLRGHDTVRFAETIGPPSVLVPPP